VLDRHRSLLRVVDTKKMANADRGCRGDRRGLSEKSLMENQRDMRSAMGMGGGWVRPRSHRPSRSVQLTPASIGAGSGLGCRTRSAAAIPSAT
jgi:hypothetical protein